MCIRDRIGSSPRAVDALVGCFEVGSKRVVEEAMDSLVHFGPTIVPELIPRLDHENRYVRIYCARVLGRFGPDAGAARERLAEIAADEKEIDLGWGDMINIPVLKDWQHEPAGT